VANTHEHGNLLLQPINLGLLAGTSPLLELLDGVTCAASLLNTQVNGSEMSLSQLLLDLVLLVESVGGTLKRVPEDEARLFQDGKFVALLQFATLISAYKRVVDECTVSRSAKIRQCLFETVFDFN
jgi:hypothetical protein